MSSSEATLEILSTALNAEGYARRRVEGGDLSGEAIRAEVRASNVLLDASIDAGMSHAEPDHVAWAHKRVTAWLLSGVEAV